MKRVLFIVMVAVFLLGGAAACKSKKDMSITGEERSRMDSDQQRHRRVFESENK